MNTPSAKADGFSVNAGVNNLYVSDRSPIQGPVKNYQSRNMISWQRQTAVRTQVPALADGLGHTVKIEQWEVKLQTPIAGGEACYLFASSASNKLEVITLWWLVCIGLVVAALLLIELLGGLRGEP